MSDVRMSSLMLLTVLTVYKGSDRQPGLGVLRGVAGGVAEEARIRGFPSPSFGGFGFVVALLKG